MRPCDEPGSRWRHQVGIERSPTAAGSANGFALSPNVATKAVLSHTTREASSSSLLPEAARPRPRRPRARPQTHLGRPSRSPRIRQPVTPFRVPPGDGPVPLRLAIDFRVPVRLVRLRPAVRRVPLAVVAVPEAPVKVDRAPPLPHDDVRLPRQPGTRETGWGRTGMACPAPAFPGEGHCS